MTCTSRADSGGSARARSCTERNVERLRLTIYETNGQTFARVLARWLGGEPLRCRRLSHLLDQPRRGALSPGPEGVSPAYRSERGDKIGHDSTMSTSARLARGRSLRALLAPHQYRVITADEDMRAAVALSRNAVAVSGRLLTQARSAGVP